MQRPRHVLVSDDEDETMAKRSFLGESGEFAEAEGTTCGESFSWFADQRVPMNIWTQHGWIL